MYTSVDDARPNPMPLPTIPTGRAIRPRPPLPFVFDLDDGPDEPRTPRWVRWVLVPLALLVSIGTVLALVAVGAVHVGEAISVPTPTTAPLPSPPSAGAPTSLPVTPTAAPPEMHAAEAAYLERAHAAGLSQYGNDQDLVDLGYRICDGWSSGMAFGGFDHALTEVGYSLDDAETQVRLATQGLCPMFANGLPGGA